MEQEGSRGEFLSEFGEWGDLVRELAGHDVSRYAGVLRWPVGEALAAFEHQMRQEALRRWEMDTLLWAVLAQSGRAKKKTPPEPPAILK